MTKMTAARTLGTLLACGWLAGCVTATAPAPAADAAAASPPPRAAVVAVADRVADWQLGHMSDFGSYIDTLVEHTAAPRGWVQGTFLAGLATWAGTTGNREYFEYLERYAALQGFELGDRVYHADDHVVGQYYLALHERNGDPRFIAPLVARFERILADPPQADLDFGARGRLRSQGYGYDCQVRWCWADALFMSPPVWFRLSEVTGDERFRAYADREYRATVDFLFDERAGLFYRDSRFFDRYDANGNHIFWSRGNGWVFYGLTRVLDTLEPGTALHRYYAGLYRKMADALVPLQKDDGYWPVSLLGAELHPAKETSGTGFFVAGLAWGMNHGIVDGCRYARAVSRGWQALVDAVDENGKLGHVQQIGYAPDRVAADDTQLYGVGAFLMASAELHEMSPRRGPGRFPGCTE